MARGKLPYTVGYGNPPKDHQFSPGQSGNPKGRPKGAKNKKTDHPLASNPVNAMLMQELGAPMEVTERGERFNMPALQVIIRKLKVEAVRGDFRAQKLALNLATMVAAVEQSERMDRIAYADWYKGTWKPSFDAARKAGTREPSQLPHPDHVIFTDKPDAVLVGPENQEQKEWWDLTKAALRTLDDHVRNMEEKLRRRPRSKRLADEIKDLRKLLRKIEAEQVPAGWNWREWVTDEDHRYYAAQLNTVRDAEEW